MIESIKNLIDLMNNNVITAYKVSKETGVSQLKCGKIKVENLRIVTDIKLEKYYRSLNQWNLLWKYQKQIGKNFL